MWQLEFHQSKCTLLNAQGIQWRLQNFTIVKRLNSLMNKSTLDHPFLQPENESQNYRAHLSVTTYQSKDFSL